MRVCESAFAMNIGRGWFVLVKNANIGPFLLASKGYAVFQLHAVAWIAQLVFEHHHIQLPDCFFRREFDGLGADQALDAQRCRLAAHLSRDTGFQCGNVRGFELGEFVGAVFEQVGKGHRSLLPHPTPGVAPQLHPGAESAALQRGPAHLDVAENALGVRHHGGKAAIGGGHCRQTARAAVGVEGVGFGGRTVVVGVAHGGQHLGGVAPMLEVGIAFAVRHGNG